MLAIISIAAWLLAVASSHPLLYPSRSCPSLGSGTIDIASYQLYPENADFDEQSCLLCFTTIANRDYHPSDLGALYNASVVVYDPYKKSVVETIEFPNITRTVPFHIGGVAWDPYSSKKPNSKSEAKKPGDEITILVDAAPAHETAGRDISGDNYILRWDAVSKRVLWTANLTTVSRGRYGGPQDIEHDGRGNVFVLGTYPGTLVRVSAPPSNSKTGVIEEWYIPPPSPNTSVLDHAVIGFTGLAAYDSDTLLVADARNNSVQGGALYRFDMSAKKGTPVAIPITYPTTGSADADVIRPGDAIYLPKRYAREVLLISEHDKGVSVVRSRKKDEVWRSAEFLGRIANPANITASGGLVTAVVEIAGRVYLVEEWFTDAIVPGTSAGNRTTFPLVDVTAQLDALVRGR
ncbi:hypothetical protein F4777DRAFT_580780 [Nemania sp. FL0916]|nr:hypothetical protein F4777DRAFT_580780 [Nemania sp. FL0916]